MGGDRNWHSRSSSDDVTFAIERVVISLGRKFMGCGR